MGYIPEAGKIRETGFFSVPYTQMKSGECPVENFQKMCSGQAVFEFKLGEDEQHSVYVDVNPKDDDGYEYKLVCKKLLDVWNNNFWKTADCANRPAIKDSNGSEVTTGFYDYEFRRCMEYVYPVSEQSIPQQCRNLEKRADVRGCTRQLTGSPLGDTPIGIFLEAYDRACGQYY